MKTRTVRKTLALILIAGLMLGLSACSFNGAMAKAVTKLSKVESFHSLMTMDIDFAVSGVKTSAYAEMSSDCFVEPYLMRGDMTISTLGVDMTTQYYADKNGEAYNIYSSTDGEDWELSTTDDTGKTGSIDTSAALSFYLSAASSFEKIGIETVNGEKAVRYDGYIPEDSVIEVVERSGISDMLSLDSDTSLSSLLRGIGDLPVSVWLAKSSGLPVKFTMDMSNVLDVMLENAMGTLVSGFLDTEVSRALITITLSQYGAVDTFEIPAEVIASAEDD